MIRTTLLAALLLAAPVAAAPVANTPKAAAAAKQLIGTWKLVRFENTRPDGTVERPYGPNPLGYFIYDASGTLSIQFMVNPPTKPFAAGDDAKGSDAEVRAAYDGYLAYFGTWKINDDATAVVHVVEGALHPSYTGTDQLRPFKLDGDTLVIRSPPAKDGTTYYRELKRVR